MGRPLPRAAAQLWPSLRARFTNLARESGGTADRCRMNFGFEVFLRRLFAPGRNPGIYLKGGYSLELRFQVARATRDLDFAVEPSLGRLLGSAVDKAQYLKDLIQDAVANPIEGSQLDQFFTILLDEEVVEIKGGGGGFRISVEVLLAQQEVAKFHVDITIGVCDKLSNHDHLPIHKCLGIDEDAVLVEAECTTVAQLFADKLHAFTKPRGGDNTRTKDLVDLYLLIQSGKLEREVVSQELLVVFTFENSHGIPEELPPPPSFWEKRFDELARECRLTVSMGEAFEVVECFWQGIAAIL